MKMFSQCTNLEEVPLELMPTVSKASQHRLTIIAGKVCLGGRFGLVKLNISLKLLDALQLIIRQQALTHC